MCSNGSLCCVHDLVVVDNSSCTLDLVVGAMAQNCVSNCNCKYNYNQNYKV